MDSLLNMMKNPGSSLTGREKKAFENVKISVDKCTDDVLNMPDWAETMVCCDLINNNAHLNQEFSNEVVALLNKKMNNGKANIVWLSLNLLETIVKNGGYKIFRAVGTENFMKDFAKVTRKYCGKADVGAENRNIADLALDMIQAWGEAFLPLRGEYPWFSRTYQELKREGLPFRPQADMSHAPTIELAPGRNSASGGGSSYDDDAALAAAIAASMKDAPAVTNNRSEVSGPRITAPAAEQSLLFGDDSTPTSDISALHQRRNSGRRGDGYGDSAPSAGSFVPSAATVNRSRGNSIVDPAALQGLPKLMAETESCMELLAQVIVAAADTRELLDNDIGSLLNSQLGTHQASLITAIEGELQKGSDNLEAIFKCNDKAGLVLSVYADFTKYKMKAPEAREKLSGLLKPVKPETSANATGGGDLLDLAFDGVSISGSAAPAASQARRVSNEAPPAFPPAQKPATSSDFDFFGTGAPTQPSAASSDPLLDLVNRRPSTGGAEVHSFFGGAPAAQKPSAGHDFFNPAPVQATSPVQPAPIPPPMQVRQMPSNGLTAPSHTATVPYGVQPMGGYPMQQQQPAPSVMYQQPAPAPQPIDPFFSGAPANTTRTAPFPPPAPTQQQQPQQQPANPFDFF